MKKALSIIISLLVLIVGGVVVARTAVYPVKDIPEIKSIAKEYKIDPYFLASIGHFESRFDEKDYEKNDNNGILRFSDETSIKLAHELNIQNFKPSDLVNDKTSLKLGAYYLSKFKDEGLSKMVQEWNVRNKVDDTIDRRAYAKEYYVPKIEKNMKIIKILYPEMSF
ncbi:transglycosylase SLT domain-containing protein [Paraclostridium bifermentans]|jgi:soluble lytic murein transglycosylase|uniref:transglycosylase SLT domain-containing protein n=1 Tax=Paraclostridium bifermentans TaxID=1490 RepID=UPI000DF7D3BA|nr:transglycosylase SLT domain-containing protein [Paraclostridium bifermentans]MBS5954452.1 transglycosylase SLT domain-containing protein [Paraclostridium bifermentans]MBU5288759.1 transglycosylase SLT domain-containing protein [Paraclostridium bifermentans]MDU3337663.1 transglycosylase SLT domain-containing protein [Paraclostridium bifermentans]RDC49580.1 lytic transglycosylase domain-containing protein [Acinetobacter sp. RIT592]